jgi:hypothetical protein
MIIKKRSAQINFLGQAALKKRLDIDHHKFNDVESNYFRSKAGVSGEDFVDQQLARYEHPETHFIIHDLHLKSSSFFQIDNLFVTQSFALIIEVKNIKHTVDLMQNPHFMKQTSPEGKVVIMDSPEEQLDKNIIWLKDWFLRRNWVLPVEGVIVFTNSDSNIIPNKCKYDIVRPRYLTKKIRKMVTSKEVLSQEQLIRLGEELLMNHRDYEQKALQAKYNLTSTDIITGVECPVCFEIGMKWTKRKWVCSNNHVSTNAHLQTLEDYFYIFGPEINNTEFRRFFHISSKDVAARMLKKLNLNEIGKGRWRRYRKPLLKQ